MPKIPNLFNGISISPECEWVLEGAHATKMIDGIGYVLGLNRIYSCGIIQEEFDPILFEALTYHQIDSDGLFRPWSYELVGPDIKGNHEQQPRHILIPHGRRLYSELTGTEVTYEAIKKFLAGRNTEGVIFWADIWDYNCRKAKVTQKDFGFKRNLKGDRE